MLRVSNINNVNNVLGVTHAGAFFSSPKGGAGKTTASVILATELAGKGAGVTIFDADLNRNAVNWAKLPGVPASLTVVGDVSEETIVDQIEEVSSHLLGGGAPGGDTGRRCLRGSAAMARSPDREVVVAASAS